MRIEDLNKIRNKYNLLQSSKMAYYKRINAAFSGIENLQGLSNTMVYMGTYASKFIEYNETYEILETVLDKDDNRAMYRKYKNLESGYETDIDIDMDCFYQENVPIIFLPKCESKKEYLYYYKKVRDKYFELLLIFPPNKAMEKILSDDYIRHIVHKKENLDVKTRHLKK